MIACSIKDIRIVVKNIVMYRYTGVSLQAYSVDLIRFNTTEVQALKFETVQGLTVSSN